MIGWRFKPPFGAVYFIYSLDRFGDVTGLPDSDNLFLKLTYPISFLK